MYEISEIYQAIQGEGYHAGLPCTIVRMLGCNLRCKFCDTPQAQQPGLLEKWTLEDLLQEIEDKLTPSKVVLITGGEPLLQNLKPLVAALASRGIKTHLETNGTLPPPDIYIDWITMSPKPPSVCYQSIVEVANEIKWLVAAEGDITQLMFWLAARRQPANRIISVQPISQDPLATKICYDACIKYGWRLSLQQHKLIGEK